MTSLSIKLALAALALAVLLTAPVEAAKRKQRKEVRPPVPHASAQVARYRGGNLFPAGPLYHGPDYIGDDPDPFIRLQLMRDLGARYGGATP
jgi:hypothetical protein